MEQTIQAEWYVAHTYSGYENKVKVELEKTVENRKMQDQILEIAIPMEQVMEETEDGKKLVNRKMFPGYVLIHMVMNDTTWYVIRNTRGVTSFVGPESKPSPLTAAEVEKMGLVKVSVQSAFAVGDYVMVTGETMQGTKATITDVNSSKRTVTIMCEMFGREVPVELDFKDVKKI